MFTLIGSETSTTNRVCRLTGIYRAIGICTNPNMIGPGTDYVGNMRGVDEDIKPIVQHITDAGITIVPVQTWSDISHQEG